MNRQRRVFARGWHRSSGPWVAILAAALHLAACASDESEGPADGPEDTDSGLPPGLVDYDPALCTVDEPADLLGFDAGYARIESGDGSQDKNFYLLTALAEDAALRGVVAADTTLADVAAAQRAGLATAAESCDGDCDCVGSLLDLVGQRDDIVEALGALFGGAAPAVDLVETHLRPSGLFGRYAAEDDDELLALAWDETSAGLVGAFERFCGEAGAAATASAVTTVADDLDEDALFFEPLLTLTMALLEVTGRDEAGRYEPLEAGENQAAFERMQGLDWDAYPFGLILVPGQGPGDLETALNPLGMERCDLAVARLNAGLAPLILTSGGHVHPDRTPYSEAVEMKRYLMNTYGVPDDHLLIDPHARHTTTNLRNTSRLALRYGVPPDKPLLVTTDTLQSIYVTALGPRCENELFYLPWRLMQELTPTDHCWLVAPVSLHAAPSDPLDP